MARDNGMMYLVAIRTAQQFLELRRKPIVTAALIVANTLVHFRPGPLDRILPHLADVCLNPHLIWEGAKCVCERILSSFGLGLARRSAGRDSPLSILQERFSYLVFDGLLPDIWGGRGLTSPRVGKARDLRRLVLSAFYHVDHAHLIYNMASLLSKGGQLEQTYGSLNFAAMVAVLLGLSHGLVVLSSKLLDTFAGILGPMYRCSVGFSAVLFAMKVVVDQDVQSNLIDVLGFTVPTRYAPWAELLLVHVAFRDSSFLAHLCGILAGFIYVRLWPRRSNGRLSWIISPILFLLWPLTWVCTRICNRIMGSLRPRGRFSGGSHRRRMPAPDVWRCRACTAVNTVLQDNCEMCQTGRDVSDATPSAPPGSGGGLPVEQLRQRRLETIARLSRR